MTTTASRRVRAYLAASLDGCIADRDGGVDWLAPWDPHALGFDAFLAGVDVLLMGRTSFDQALALGLDVYGERPVVVVTSRPLPRHAPARVRADDGRDLAALVEGLSGDIWLFGGADLIRQLLDLDLVDTLEIVWLPIRLGDGIPLFAPGQGRTRWRLAEHRTWPGQDALGVVWERVRP